MKSSKKKSRAVLKDQSLFLSIEDTQFTLAMREKKNKNCAKSTVNHPKLTYPINTQPERLPLRLKTIRFSFDEQRQRYLQFNSILLVFLSSLEKNTNKDNYWLLSTNQFISFHLFLSYQVLNDTNFLSQKTSNKQQYNPIVESKGMLKEY